MGLHLSQKSDPAPIHAYLNEDRDGLIDIVLVLGPQIIVQCIVILLEKIDHNKQVDNMTNHQKNASQ